TLDELTLLALLLLDAAVPLHVDPLPPEIRLDLFRLLDRPLAHDHLLLDDWALLDDELLLRQRHVDLLLLDPSLPAPHPAHRPPLDLDLLVTARHRLPDVLRFDVLVQLDLASL